MTYMVNACVPLSVNNQEGTRSRVSGRSAASVATGLIPHHSRRAACNPWRSASAAREKRTCNSATDSEARQAARENKAEEQVLTA